MDLEKLSARSRSTLMVVSLVGFVVLMIGVGLTLAVINKAANGPGGDWINGLGQTGGPLTLAAVGLLMACLPWGAMAMLNVVARMGVDARYRAEQLLGQLEGNRQTLESIREIGLLSDAAKQIAYRAKDLEALRAAIREDIDKGDFEAATMLVTAMEERFGYVAEANKFRGQIEETSRAAIDARVRDTIERIEQLIEKRDWVSAARESELLLRQFPTHAEARKLPGRVQDAQDDTKRRLLKQWEEAVARDDVDRSIQLLRELDMYLEPSEAEAYKESARDVFKKRLQQLGSQFALQVHDKNWAEALRLGRLIVAEFPNTRMAGEVRDRLKVLQEKAERPVAV
jgi:hypothetical protein